MDNSVGGRNIRGDDISVVDLNLSIRLLQSQGRSTGHRVLDLVESHSSGEQRSLDQVLRDKLLGQILVRHEVCQFFGRELREGIVGGRKDSVGLDACKRKDVELIH